MNIREGIAIHKMKLQPSAFRKVYEGKKTIELRVLDEKRKTVKVGDRIEFHSTENEKFYVVTEVIALHCFATFQELYEKLPLDQCGYITEEEKENASYLDMSKYYSEEEQKKYGVVGIELKVIEKPFRDVYRFEGFLSEIESLWKSRYPSYRFGQLISNFECWLQSVKRINTLYCLEEEDFLRLFKEYIQQ